MRADARDDLLDRLRGKPPGESTAPAFFRDRRDDDVVGLVPSDHSPRFLESGRRQVHFHSATSIPAVLLAHAALGSLEISPPASAAGKCGAGEEELAALPEAYRSGDARRLSYPLVQGSIISSGDIVFRPGSTRFADTHSYEMARILAEAMKDEGIAGARFVIECHASAEGEFEENRILSQQRAEAIARELVRNGLSPERLVPVGHGEAAAKHPADAAEEMRSMDRRVIIGRLGETDAER